MALASALLPVLAQQRRTHPIKQLLQSATVGHGLLKQRHQLGRHIQTAPPSLLSQREGPDQMFVAPSAGRAVGTHAGFTYCGYRALESGPKLLEFSKKLLAQ